MQPFARLSLPAPGLREEVAARSLGILLAGLLTIHLLVTRLHGLQLGRSSRIGRLRRGGLWAHLVHELFHFS